MGLFQAAEARPTRPQDFWLSAVLLALFWGLAFLIMLNDIDFFSLHDLFDTRELHHEHIVVVLFLGGIVAAVLPLIAARFQRMEN